MEHNDDFGTPLDWYKAKELARFFFSGAAVLVGLGVFLWGLSLLIRAF
jgi:hypothetical protein